MEGSTFKKYTNVDHLLMKVERNQSIVFKFLKKLNSYRCEPTDYRCFVKVGQLKHGFKELAAEQQDLILNARKIAKQKLQGQITACLNRFQELQAEMEAYLLDTNSYY
ncbi:hypothetical protein [Allomuricauda sp. SCSIO 65647]|uniref:hypothetical protein n=1 Tax=Allomuricauda sp. SCSIO 65647 TaxID=2908843 RepID=UPI001F264E03|nr:hypothetical protein [Muricauda sp. SCSIO 65647]UJH67388.1 hypothetical protein L0P89_15740 [Muricauda sp. SCSIO 65647]